MPETAEEKAAREAREDRGRGGPTDEGRGVARKLLNRFRGRAEEALAHMADEAKDLRIDRRELQEKLKKIEAPGTVILTADDAKDYEAFKALNTKAGDLKKVLDEVPTLRAKIVEHDRRTAADEAAPLVGYNPAALRELVADKKLELSFREEVKDGKTVRVPLVKPSGAEHEKTAPVPLIDYAKQNLATYIPALMAKPAAGGATTQTATPGKTGTPYVEQSSGSSTAPNGDGGDKPRTPATSGNYLTPGMRAKQNTTS